MVLGAVAVGPLDCPYPVIIAVVVHIDVSAADFALAETLRTVPEVTVVSEQLVGGLTTAPVSLIWIRATEHPAVEDALIRDPTVATATLLADTETAWLYWIAWTQRVQVVVNMLTPATATTLDAAGSAAGWQLHVLHPDRTDIRQTHDTCAEHNVSVDIRAIRTADIPTQLDPAGDLTEKQYEALAHAYIRGDFTIPRTATLEKLAEELDISHQALSERLRRAYHGIIQEALASSLAERRTN